MNFLQTIFRRCSQASAVTVLREARTEAKDGAVAAVTGGEFLALVNTARGYLRRAGLKRGDRCALLAPNSIRWAALDLAIIAEGGVVVPLYSRQAPSELVEMMRDSSPSLVCCGDQSLRDSIDQLWPEALRFALFNTIFDQSGSQPVSDAPQPIADDDAVTIIYTSGTSGEAKGVILAAGNVNFMLRRTSSRLDALMGSPSAPDRVFHYLPCCFAGSWILLLTCLSRNSILTLSTDLTKLADEMKLAAPDYFLNVPALLERMKTGIEGQFAQWGGARNLLFNKGKEAWLRRREGKRFLFDFLWLTAAETFIFPAIKKKVSPDLKALICGSAPLSLETQLFFAMLDIQVLQVYGLTETTAICTMDHPHRVEPGRVGPAIEGIEMKLGSGDEILVRGPNIFQGYWNRPRATSDAMRNGWFHTGDQGEIDGGGNWRVTGRIKNLIVLGSGHNVAPEPIEESLLKTVPGAHQAVIVGTGRGFLSAILTGDVPREHVDAALEAINSKLPHYRRVRAFCVHKEPFTVDNGLLTANGKLKRDLIAQRLSGEIDEMYREKESMNSFEGKTLSWKLDDGVVNVELHRAPCNEIGSQTLDELEQFANWLDEAARSGNEEARVVILHSALELGFCAGADLRELYHGSNRLGSADRIAGVRDFLTRIHRVMNIIDASPLVTIAAVHGVTFGGGFELALACDLIIADKTAKFCFPELRLGLIPGFGGIPRLKRDVGNAVIRDLLLTGRSFNVNKAQTIGLVSQVAAAGEAMRLARSAAAQIKKFDPRTRSTAKRFIKPVPKEELRQEIEIFCELFSRPVVQEALRRFVENTAALPYLP